MPEYKFLSKTQSENKGDIVSLDATADRTKQLMDRGLIELYTPVVETKVVAPKQTKRGKK